MKQAFKFRHADEIAGTFVIIAAILLLVAVFFAGKSQGWFEGSFPLKVVFDTPDGSFGLQEGAVVQVRNTVAGRVGKIAPTEDGLMGTTLIIKERFRPFIRKDSVAKIKKTFGLAGDTYVEIERGKGGKIVDNNDVIKCIKDEEILDTAQNMIKQVQESMQPLLEDVQKILDSVSGILNSLNTGEGIAGAAINDGDMRDDMKSIVKHLEAIAGSTQSSMAQLSTIISNDVPNIMSDVMTMTGQARLMLTNQVPKLMDPLPELEEATLSTIIETRRLIEGLQHHWLIRKYIKHDSDVVPLIPAVFVVVGDDKLKQKLEKALNEDRRSDNSAAIARDAYNLAVCNLASDNITAAKRLNTEARIACRSANVSPASTYLLEAEIARLSHNLKTAAELTKNAIKILGKHDKETRTEARIMLATIYLDEGDTDAATAELVRAEKSNRKDGLPQYTAAIAGIRAGIAMHSGDQAAAAGWFAKQATALRKCEDYKSMTTALRQAADIYNNAGMYASAAEYYYRAAVALDANEESTRAISIMKLAATAAKASGDSLLAQRIQQWQAENQPAKPRTNTTE